MVDLENALTTFILPAVAVVAGLFFVLRPRAVALQNRDDEKDTSPPTPGEIWSVRIAGCFFLFVGAHFLLAGLGLIVFNGRADGPDF